MRCLACGAFSWQLVCAACQTKFLSPTPSKRENRGCDVYSFYPYSEIQELLKHKYSPLGTSLYALLARRAFASLGDYFVGVEEEIFIIGIDDIPRRDFSHTALLARELAKMNTRFLWLKQALIAKNHTHYAGKSLAYREENPRNFVWQGPRSGSAILIDDIITTGTTLREARDCVESQGLKVLFAVVLSDARL